MASRTFDVQVQPDFLERLTAARPVSAIAELIWNGLDADATNVSVRINRDSLDQLSTIAVVDNGHGIPYEEADTLLGRLGGSWKRLARYSKGRRRLLHGEGGKGRFRALALGRVAEWEIVAGHLGKPCLYTITINRDNPRSVEVSDPEPMPEGTPSGVQVTIYDLFRQYRLDDAPVELTQVLALYLTDYSDVVVTFDGLRLDPSAQIVDRRSFVLTPIVDNGEEPTGVTLDLVEWRSHVERHLYLCGGSSFPLSRVPANVQAPGFHFTGYLKSDYVSRLNDQGTLDLAEMDPTLAKSISEARATVREHFKARAAQNALAIVEEWKKERVYPFEGEPQTTVASLDFHGREFA